MKRPIFIILLSYTISILINEFVKLNLNLVIFIVLGYFILFIKYPKTALISIFILVISLISMSLRYENKTIKSGKYSIQAEVISKKSNKFGYSYEITSKEYNYLIQSNENFNLGSILNIKGKFQIPESENNFNVFNKEKYYKSKKIFYEIKPYSINKIGESKSIKYFIHRHVESILEKNLSTETSNLLKSMILGIRNESDFSNYKELGLAHVLAISGLHINIMILFLDIIGKKLKIDKKYYSIIIIILLVFYGHITNFPVSLIRALSIYIISVSAIYTKNIKDDINIFILSILICLIINPFYIYSAAFYLSYASIFSLTYIKKRMQNIFIKVDKKILTMIAVQIGLLPFLIYYFNSINLLTILINLLTLPLISFGLFSGFLLILTNFNLIAKMVEIVFNLVDLLLSPFLMVKDTFSIRLSFSIIDIVIYYVILIVILNYRIVLNRTRKYRTYIYSILSIVMIKYLFLPVVILNFIDIGQGDALLIRDNGINIMYDTGGNPLNPKISGEKLYKYLINNKVYNFHSIFISHSDFDHIGNLEYLVKKMKIKNLYNNSKNQYKRNILREKEKIKISRLNFLVVLDGLERKTSNDASLVLLLEIYGKKILLTGDVEENEVNIKINDTIDFLKVAHHGSKHSTKKEFLKNNKIDTAIISAGKNNRYGHPTSEVLNRLDKEKIKIYRTDTQGNIEIRINRFGSFIHAYKSKYDIFQIFIRLVLF